MSLKHAARPCPDCPWRRDAPLQHFPAERYELLRDTVRQPDENGHADAPLDAPLFGCHATPRGGEHACAGWLAVEGLGHLRVRMALSLGDLEPEAIRPGEGWPELYESYDEMVAAQRFDAPDIWGS